MTTCQLPGNDAQKIQAESQPRAEERSFCGRREGRKEVDEGRQAGRKEFDEDRQEGGEWRNEGDEGRC